MIRKLLAALLAFCISGLTALGILPDRQPESTAALPEQWQANCEEYITLREAPEVTAGELARIPAGEQMEMLSWEGKFARVSWENQEGYVLSSYIKPASPLWFSAALTTVAPVQDYSYEQLNRDLSLLCAQYPEYAETEQLGSSELGRPVSVLRLGSSEAEHHILLQGAIHGREHMTAWLLMAMADYLLQRGIPEAVCFHIIPMSNPDGVILSQSGRLDDSQQRIYQNDIRLGHTELEEADYAVQWKANGLGTDLNRNFPSGWELIDNRTGPSSEQYRGEAPFSAAETKILRDYTLRYPFGVTLSYHASGSILYYAYGDAQPVNVLSESLAGAVKEVTGYPLADSTGVDGAGYKDWAMDELGIPSLTVEIGCGEAPLQERELYSIFVRNCGVPEAVAQWLQFSEKEIFCPQF